MSPQRKYHGHTVGLATTTTSSVTPRRYVALAGRALVTSSAMRASASTAKTSWTTVITALVATPSPRACTSEPSSVATETTGVVSTRSSVGMRSAAGLSHDHP